ncbi:MAG: hypothetical protein E7317_06770 [Clostridiales bacterium]|nr:hypothetical protein [Clostridiales bacterium]
MLRRLWPAILTVVTMLLDTAVIPVIYHGTYTIPLTYSVVMCISLLLGNLRGLLYGMIGGLLIDISTGTLGIMTFPFMLTGFAMGLIIDRKTDASGPRLRRYLRRGGLASAMFFAGELVFVIYRFFVTNSFAWPYLLHGLIRAAMAGVFTMLFYRPIRRLFYGKADRARPRTPDEEVKHF